MNQTVTRLVNADREAKEIPLPTRRVSPHCPGHLSWGEQMVMYYENVPYPDEQEED
jgi:hypothetical protein